MATSSRSLALVDLIRLSASVQGGSCPWTRPRLKRRTVTLEHSLDRAPVYAELAGQIRGPCAIGIAVQNLVDLGGRQPAMHFAFGGVLRLARMEDGRFDQPDERVSAVRTYSRQDH